MAFNTLDACMIRLRDVSFRMVIDFLGAGAYLSPNFESRERISNDQRDVHPPEAVVVEFGQEDVFCNLTASADHTDSGDWGDED